MMHDDEIIDGSVGAGECPEPAPGAPLRQCAACGSIGFPHERFCAACGDLLGERPPPGPNACMACGNQSRHPVAFYCTHCGRALRST